MAQLTFSQKENLILKKIDSLYTLEKYKNIIDLNTSGLSELNSNYKAKALFKIAKSYENLNKEDIALKYYKEALEIEKALRNFEKVTEINLEIYLLLNSQNSLNSEKDNYLEEVHKYARSKKLNKWLASYYANYGVKLYEKKFDKNLKHRKDSIKTYADSSKYFFEKALVLALKIDSIQMQTNLNINLASTFSRKYNDQDSAIALYEKALNIYYSDTINNKNINTEFNILNNLGNAYRRKKDYQNALKFYNKAESFKLPKLDRKSKKILFSNIDATYYYMNDWQNAYDYLYKYDSIKNIINLKEQNASIIDIEEKYNNEKLRADNLELEAEDAKKRTLLLSALGFIIFGSIVFLLIQKNTKKKQKLAEQEKEIQTQKLATVLKEQELNAIDAMIEGQEKERQRIANDLHDDLGGLMATVKLHFNALKDKKSPELFNKTNSLIDEAYNKVRSVAHAKNSGVIAKHGLLKSIKEMASKISISNKLNIEVIDYGLDNRLENSLELTIFRITQELVSNAIKHAEASEITIHLTNHEDSINLMVEDNGKGFDTSQITKTAKGMGIGSIDKRVEHLDGKMTIESEKNKGTTVIIDIPL
ncbi:ATP-binding protein [Winogradskyella litorisediminis]|uniref:Oxygen sensor histidine kinase NreB n=1 Tax=Winogradskyella litorisediminis TaxID=1156618 RepID=A0ABW3N8M4_9FLAO